MSRLRYLGFRVLQTVFMLWFVMTFLFVLFKLMPGNITDLMLFRGASPETVEAFEQRWGLNDPLYVQYYKYLYNLAIKFNAGTSLDTGQPVLEYIRRPLYNTFVLFAPAVTVGYLIGSFSGTIMGFYQGTKLDKYGTVPLVVAGSFPSFFTAILLVIVFAGWLNWFPTSGLVSPSTYLDYKGAPIWRLYLTKDFLLHYTLPFSAIVLRYLFFPSVIMRTSVVEVLGQNFTFYHRMTGLPWRSRLKHIAKHASLPVITLYPISMARAIGGLVLIEVVFNWPGMGSLLIQAVQFRDFPVIQFVFFIIASFVIISNFVVDIVYGIIDPRVSISG